MKELVNAAKEINKILLECEEDNLGYDATLAKISSVKVHGVVFPRLMLVELIGEYAEEVAREIVDGDPDMQQSFDEAERKWSKLH